MEEQNPWLKAAAARSPAFITPPPTVEESSQPVVTGPQFGVPVPDQADRLPQRVTGHTATVWWVGVAGGAGESALATIAQGSRAADHAWPVPESAGIVNRVVLVARTNFAGLTAAQRAATEWAAGVLGDGIQLEGLALVPDIPGRLPKELRDLIQVVSGGVPRTWTLPWVDAWRFAPVSATDLHRGFAPMFKDLYLSSTTH
ncbi:MAG: DUF6668 family protein [Microbacteriaceae bacterium]